MTIVHRFASVDTHPRRPAGRVIGWAVILLLASLMPTGCGGSPEPPELPPHGVYDHAAAGENSRAEPVTGGGTASAVTRPLTAAGWFCAQVRVNADGRAVWCRTGHRDQAGTVHPQVAQFLFDSGGRLAWAWFPPVGQSVWPPDGDRDPGAGIAESALDTIWPGVADRIRSEIADFNRHRDPAPRADELPRTAWRDDHADYAYSTIDGLIVAVHDHSVRRWPFGAEHYATTMSSVVGDLRAGGYECAYPPQQICDRPQSNGEFRVTLHGDQIVSATFGIGSVVEAGRQRHPLTEEFPNGLTFLTKRVRRPITARIEHSRLTDTGFTGIVAGTVLIIDADGTPTHAEDFAAHFTIQIGAPLTATLPV